MQHRIQGHPHIVISSCWWLLRLLRLTISRWHRHRHLFCICIVFNFLSLQISTALVLPRPIGSVKRFLVETSQFKFLWFCMLSENSFPLMMSFQCNKSEWHGPQCLGGLGARRTHTRDHNCSDCCQMKAQLIPQSKHDLHRGDSGPLAIVSLQT